MLKVSVRTNIGKMRTVNQDTVFCSTDSVGPLSNLFIVADGMGGHNGGEIASQVAINRFCDHIRTSETTADGVLDLLTSAAHAANLGVLAKAKTDPELAGMGTTLTACNINCDDNNNTKCHIIHLGDSRAYVITPDKIEQLTHDHSYVNEMVKAGQLTQNEAREHPKRNVLTKVIGINPEISADGYIRDIQPGSIILLCSDGLYNMVPEDEIKKLIEQNPDEPAKALVSAANDGGGTDNISAVVIKIPHYCDLICRES